MALLKEITDEKGIITKYHKISSFVVDTENQLVRVIIKNYTNQTYREKEKANTKITEDFKNKYLELNRLIDKNGDGYYTEEIVKISEEINSVMEVKDNEPPLAVSDASELLRYDPEGDYSLAGIYEELKQTEKYAGSEDI